MIQSATTANAKTAQHNGQSIGPKSEPDGLQFVIPLDRNAAMNEIPNVGDEDFAAYGSTPLLVAYIVFTAMTLLASVAILLVPQIGEIAAPYFGSPVIGMFYAGNLIFVIMKLGAPNSYANDKFLLAMRNLLGIVAVFGVFTAALSWLGGNYNNPYLTVNAIQPLWTVGVPIAWYLVLRRFA